MNLHKQLIAVLLGLCCQLAIADESRPNILLLVADDLGYADLGVHGSRIKTPNIDALANQGMIFSQFHTAPMCAPTRAMLLSGNNNHVAGMGSQYPSKLDGTSGFEHHLSERIIPFPALLKEAGYHTYMAGKWHLGRTAELSPIHAGFERSFALDDGGANHFDGRGFMPYPSQYFEDGKLTEWPKGAYSTNFYTDKLISYLEADKRSDQPFFIYAAYTSPHWPLQVPAAELDRYKGAYDAGYEVQRQENLANLIKAGMVPAHQQLGNLHPHYQPWESLSSDEKKRQARAMELYAAMVSNLDDNIGRLIAYLDSIGKLDNTLIVFMGDNGPASSDIYNRGPFTKSLQSKYDNTRLEDFGKPDTFVSYGLQWAEAASPFKFVKGYTSEGGVRAPFIVSGAGVKQASQINHDYVTVMDLAPTFLQLANTTYPADKGRLPLQGGSMVDTLAGKQANVHGNDYVTVIDHNNHALVRKGNWKLVSTDSFVDKTFALYNVMDDPAELHDVAAQYPEVYQELWSAWQDKIKQYGIKHIPGRVIPE